MKRAILTGTQMIKQFKGSENPVLDNVSIALYEGDFTIIMGASGAGKSTLLYALSGMNRMDGGHVVYQERDITNLSESEMAILRSRDFGFIFQQTHLVSNLTLFENVAVAGYLNKDRSTEESDQRARKRLKQMDVEHAMNRYPSKVSGGEAQRAAIARAIINEPKLLFADEPTGALNRKNSEEVLHILNDLNKQGQSIVMVTHDMHAATHGNRIIYLQDGKILAELDLSGQKYMEMKEREAYVSEWLTTFLW